MGLKTVETNINLEMTGDTRHYMVSAKQGDKATRYVVVKLLSNGADYTIPKGARAVVNIKKPDGKRVYNTCEYSDSTVMVELTNQALAVPGTAYCDIEIRTEDDTQIISSASFTIEIEKSMRSDSAIISSNEYTELEERLAGHIKDIDDTNKAVQEAETERVRAENQRVQNELLRKQQEEERQQNASQAIENVDTAAKAAVDLVKEIEEKVENGYFTATIDVGRTITGVPGSQAEVINQGTKRDVILEITIPQGPVGPQGPQGETGAQGEQGPQGIPGEAGLKGDTGAVGPQGPKGDTGETGPQGPQGIQGLKGDTGPQGPVGESGVTTPVNGFITFSVDSEGNLWVNSQDDIVPNFELDSDKNLYYITPDE